MVNKVRTLDFLPEIFRTKPNQEFLGATLDQLVQPPITQRVEGYIGRKFEYGIDPNAVYVNESNKTRQNYQLEPGVVFTRPDTSTAKDAISYPGIIDAIQNQNGITDNHSILFKNEFYSWDSFVDLDKLVNFSQYYWLPDGPDIVPVTTEVVNSQVDFTVVSGISVYSFRENFKRIPQSNPTLKLVRGGTYKFIVNQNSKFWIQTNPGTNGQSPIRTNISTREIYGVENNGANQGIVEFTVPQASDQDEWIFPGENYVDLISETPISELHGKYFSDIVLKYPKGVIDGLNQIRDKRVLFLNYKPGEAVPLPVPYDVYQLDEKEFDDFPLTIPNNNFYKIKFVQTLSDDFLIIVEEDGELPVSEKITAINGRKFINKDFVRLPLGEVAKIPIITAPLDTLYYQDENVPGKVGTIKILDSKINNAINVETDILGKINYTGPNGVKFTNGLKVKFVGNIIPNKFKEGSYYVEGVGTDIKLVKAEDLNVVEPFGQLIYTIYDNEPFDTIRYGGRTSMPVQKDYITINRSAANKNAWSRSNRWFHMDVLKATANYTSGPIALAALNNRENRANRPILEFYPDLKLFNTGTIGKGSVDYIDFITTDVMNDDPTKGIVGRTSYAPLDKKNESDQFVAVQGSRIIFANDKDPNIRNKIFVVNFVSIDNDENKTIVLTKAADGDVVDLDQVYINNGKTNGGKSFYYELGAWHQAQQKTLVNQPPMFDVFDKNGTSFSNQEFYPGSNFAGCTLFEYKPGVGDNDPVLGFPIAYSSVANIGDISFRISLNEDVFKYSSLQGSITDQVSKGYPHRFTSRFDYNREIGWVKTVGESFQYQAYNFAYNPKSAFKHFECDCVVLDQKESPWPVIKVIVNENVLTADQYTVTTDNKKTYIGVKNLPNFESSVQILLHSDDDLGENAYYTIPTNLSSNPFNTPIVNLSLGDVRGHYQSIFINSQQVTGQVFGSNNYRDIGNLITYGDKIIQNSAPVTYAAALLRNKNFSLFDALTYSANEYFTYKLLITSIIEKIEYAGQSVAELLDIALQEIASYKDQNSPFFWSDMLPARAPIASNRYTFNAFIDTSFFTLSRTYDFESANYFGVLIYLTREVEGESTTIQLLKDQDYIISQDEPKVTITLDLAPGDIITINEYNQTYGSFVPNTPTKLGLYPLFKPEVIYDDTYVFPTYFIKGHDGSYTRTYGKVSESGKLIDFRDKVLLEFECRIYNNIKIKKDNFVSNDDVFSGYFRKTDFTYEYTNSLYTSNFLNWVGQNRVDYKTQYFLPDNPFTYNLDQNIFKLDDQPFKQGNWRGIYLYLYDTTTPHKTPWEMLGFVSKPKYWDKMYGAAPYTYDNKLLWDDLENGVFYNDGEKSIIPTRKRPGLSKIIPVDSQGKLRNPLDFLTTEVNSILYKREWKAGDFGPQEFSYYKSSTYPFDLIKTLAIARPAKFFALTQDLDAYSRNSEFNQWLINDRTRITNSFVNYGSGKAQHGYINWIVDYVQSFGFNGNEKLKELLNNLDVRLIYRVAGFSDKDLLKFYLEKTSAGAKSNSLLIPDESFALLLYENEPFDRIIYSSVIVQKTINGFRVYGNSQNKSYFTSYVSNYNGRYIDVTVDTTTIKVTEDFYKIPIQTPYGTEFTTIESLSEFIINYGRYLENQGMKFTNIENGLETNWLQMISEIVYWNLTGWEVGSTINVNPSANGLNIDKENAIVQPLTLFQQNYVLNQNLVPIQLKDLEVTRNGTAFTVKTLNSGDTISYFTANMSSIEHLIVFDNYTLFNDTIYNPLTGLRQHRILMKGTKTAEWKGTVDTYGFILNQDNITDWLPNTKYIKGDIVKHKNAYYVANERISAVTTFDQTKWVKTDYEVIQKGLLPNANNRSFESELYYDTTNTNLESDANLLAFSLIGYRPRDFLNASNLDDISQVNVYKNIISEKGTRLVADAVQNITLSTGQIKYDVYENWALKVSEFGGIEHENFIEFTLDEAKLTGNPGIVGIVDDDIVPNVMQVIPLNSVTNFGRSFKENNIAPLLPKNYVEKLPSAGYVHFDDVRVSSYNIPALKNNPISANDIYMDDYIWIADENDTWQVTTAIPIGGEINSIKVIEVANNLDNTVTLVFENNHGLNVGNYFILIKFDDRVNGYYEVKTVPSLKSLTVDLTLPNTVLSITGQGIAAKFQNQRVNTLSDVTNLQLTNGGFTKARVWVDEDIDGNWAVYEKSIDYKKQNIVKPNGTTKFGASVAYHNDLGYFVSDPSTGIIYRYQKDIYGVKSVGFAEILNRYNNAVVGSGFGTQIAIAQDVLIVTKPDTSSSIFVYQVKRSRTGNFISKQKIDISGHRVGDAIALSQDSNWLFVSSTSSSTNLMRVFRKTNNFQYIEVGTFTITGDVQDFNQLSLATNYDGSKVFVGSPKRDNTSPTIVNIGGAAAFNKLKEKITVNANEVNNTETFYKLAPTITSENFIDVFVNGKLIPNDQYEISKFVTPLTVELKSLVPNPDPTIETPILDSYNPPVYIWNPDIVFDVEEYFINALGNTNWNTVVGASGTYAVNNKIRIKNSVQNSTGSVYQWRLKFSYNLKAGDVIEIAYPMFVKTQEFQLSNTDQIRPGNSFGQSVATNKYGSEFLVGVPFYISDKNLEGLVLRYTNIGKKYGILKAVRNYALANPSKVLINGYCVTLPTNLSAAVDKINDAKISNIYAESQNNKLVIGVIDRKLCPVEDQLTIQALSFDVLRQLGFDEYQETQRISDPEVTNGPTQFGFSVKFNEHNSFAVGAPATTRKSLTTFDFIDDLETTNDTIFDNNYTRFVDELPAAGSVYLFDYLGNYQESINNVGKFIYAQSVNDDIRNIGIDPNYGKVIEFLDYNVLIGCPDFKNNTDRGRFVVYKNIKNSRNWNVVRKSNDVVDVDRIQNVQLFNIENNQRIDALDYIDPLQGKLLGVVADNIDYIGAFDPAGYNSKINTGNLVWGDAFIGKIWYNTSTSKFVNYHQTDVLYNSQYWGKVFPGSTVTVYTWIESSELPIDYSGPGTPYNIELYTSLFHVDNSNQLVTKYYYWVRDTNVLGAGKTLTDTIIEDYITNPENSGVSYFASLQNNVFGLYNCRNNIKNKTTGLHIGFTDRVKKDDSYNEFKLIKDGNPNDFLPGVPSAYTAYEMPESLYEKLLDSLAGLDEKGNLVPDIYLPKLLQQGVKVRPRQSFFVNRLKALENFCKYANDILIKYPISETLTPSFIAETNRESVPKRAPGFLTTSGEFFNTGDYWEFVYWWADGYNNNTKTDAEVLKYYDLATLNAFENMLAGVTTNSDGKREVYVYKNKEWTRVGLEQGTIQIKETLYNYDLTGLGFGNTFFDTDEYDVFPHTETRYIVRSLIEEIFVDELLIHRNKSLITLFEYIIGEATSSNCYLPWLNKTSLVDVTNTLRELKPDLNYTSDNQDFLKGYLREVKPYHVVMKEFAIKYTANNLYDGQITDFDLPAKYNFDLGKFITPNLTFLQPRSVGEYLPTDPIWNNPLYFDWLDNYGLSLTGQKSVTIASLTKYMSPVAEFMLVDNAHGFPINGVIKVNNEFIGYSGVDRIAGKLLFLSRGILGTTASDHNPNSKIIIDLPEVVVLDTGRNYTDVPTVVAYIDTNKYPAPLREAVLEPIMSEDKVVGITVLDSGLGYAATPEIIIQASKVIKFDSKSINYLVNTINIDGVDLVTGDIVKFVKGEGTLIKGLIANKYYYVRVIWKDETFGFQSIISLYSTLLNAKTDSHRIELVDEGSSTGNRLELAARAVSIASNTPTRELTTKLKFDRTSYVSKVTEWKSGEFYSSEFTPSGDESSKDSTLSSAITLAEDISGSTLGHTGQLARFNVSYYLYENSYGVQLVYSGNQYSRNDKITITGSLLGGTNSNNNLVIRVNSVSSTGQITTKNLNASNLIIGHTYKITKLGNTDWNQIMGTTGLVYKVGDQITPPNAGNGDGTLIAEGFIIESGVPAVQALNANLQHRVFPLQSMRQEEKTNDIIIKINYANSNISPGQLKGLPLNFYTEPVEYLYPQDLRLNEIVHGKQYKIKKLGNTNWSNFGAGSNPSVNQVFVANIVGNPVPGNGVVTAFLNANEMIIGKTYVIIELGDVNWGQTSNPATSKIFKVGDEIVCNRLITTGRGVVMEKGHALIKFYKPNFNLNKITNEYFIEVVHKGTIYNPNIANPIKEIVVDGSFLGGVSGENDAKIKIVYYRRQILENVSPKDMVPDVERKYFIKELGLTDWNYVANTVNLTYRINDQIDVVNTPPVTGNDGVVKLEETQFLYELAGKSVSDYREYYVNPINSNELRIYYDAPMVRPVKGFTEYKPYLSYNKGDLVFAHMPSPSAEQISIIEIVKGNKYSISVFGVNPSETNPSIIDSQTIYWTQVWNQIAGTNGIQYTESSEFIAVNPVPNLVGAPGVLGAVKIFEKKLFKAIIDIKPNVTSSRSLEIGKMYYLKTAGTMDLEATGIINLNQRLGTEPFVSKVNGSIFMDASSTVIQDRIKIENWMVVEKNPFPFGQSFNKQKLLSTEIQVNQKYVINELSEIVDSKAQIGKKYYILSFDTKNYNNTTNTPNTPLYTFNSELSDSVNYANYFKIYWNYIAGTSNINYVIGQEITIVNPGFGNGELTKTNWNGIAGTTEVTYKVGDTFVSVIADPNPTNVDSNINFGTVYNFVDTNVFLPEPVMITSGYSRTTSSIVSLNNRLYKCIVSNNDTEFDFDKWELLPSSFDDLNALDRIVGFYQPTTNMPGKNLPLLLTGLDYPNNTYYSNKFDEKYKLDTELKNQPFYPKDVKIKSVLWDSEKYLAVADGRDYSMVLLSYDEGVTWQIKRISSDVLHVSDVIHSGTHYVLTTRNEKSPIYISYDGLSWLGLGSYTPWDKVDFDEPGEAWDSSSLTAPSGKLYNVTSYNNYYVAAGDQIIGSTDAYAWDTVFSFNSRTEASANYIDYITSDFYTGFIAVGSGLDNAVTEGELVSSDNKTIGRVLTSADGKTWIPIYPHPTDNGLNTVIASKEIIVLAGDNGTILYTTNMLNVEPAIIQGETITDNILSGWYAANTFVLVGTNGLILVSYDGISWSKVSSGTNQNINGVTYDGQHFLAVGNNATILRSWEGLVWQNVSTIGGANTFYEVKGDPFTEGYGPEEMVPGAITDQFSMTVITRSGSTWNPEVYQHNGFKIVSNKFVPNGLEIDFSGLAEAPAQVALFAVDPFTNKSAMIYPNITTTNKNEYTYTVNWIRKIVTLNKALPEGVEILIEIYEFGNGNQLVRSTSDNIPLTVDSITGKKHFVLNALYQELITADPILYVNGQKKQFEVDYSLASTENGRTKIFFDKAYNPNENTDFISFVLFGNSLENIGYSLPETQVFEYDITGKSDLVLDNDLIENEDSIIPIIVRVNGKEIPPSDYTLSLGAVPTITINEPLSLDEEGNIDEDGSVISITSFADARKQYLLQEINNTLKVTALSSISIEQDIVYLYIIKDSSDLLPELATGFQTGDLIQIDGIIGTNQLNNNTYYMRLEPKIVTKFDKFDENGNLVIDSDGNVVTEDKDIYPITLYLDDFLSRAVSSRFLSEYIRGGFIWKYEDTHQISQPIDIKDETRLHVSVNGIRITSNGLRLNEGNYLSILTPIQDGDKVIITSMISSSTPNEMIYVNEIDKNGDQFIYRANQSNRTWLTQNLEPLQDTIYVKDVLKIIDVVNDTYIVGQGQDEKPFVKIKYDLETIKETEVFNETSLTKLKTSDFTLLTKESVAYLIFRGGVRAGDEIVVTMRLGDVININGEKIRYSKVDYENNTISRLNRGIQGTAINAIHPKYSSVVGITPRNTLFNFYYNRTWNSEIYNITRGDPLQVSDSVPAVFLQQTTK